METNIFVVILVLLMVLLSLWITLSYSILLRKIKLRDRKANKKLVFRVMAKYFKNPDRPINLSDLRKLNRAIKTNKGLWFVSQQLIKVQEIILIPEKDRPIPLVAALGIDTRLEKKISSYRWYDRALAIQYSYELGITANFKKINEHINSSHILVRREAQVAMIVFLGWKGLPYFSSVTHRMSLWQKIRIIEKLKLYKTNKRSYYIEKALEAENPDIQKLLMRLIAGLKITSHFDVIKNAVNHDNPKVAALALHLKQEIAQNHTIEAPKADDTGLLKKLQIPKS